jgi:hypothetical protein
MTSNYFFEKREQYMYLKIQGRYNKQEFMQIPRLILENCENEKLCKILVNAPWM